MNNVSVILLMVFAGSLIALQGSVNSALGKYLGHPLQAAMFSFGSGFVALCFAVLIMKSGFPTVSKLAAAPKTILIGGLLGTVFVTSVIFSVPKIGVASVVLACLCVQVVFSMILDHFGALGMPEHVIDFKRVLGTLLVISGLVLINFKR